MLLKASIGKMEYRPHKRLGTERLLYSPMFGKEKITGGGQKAMNIGRACHDEDVVVQVSRSTPHHLTALSCGIPEAPSS